MFAQVYALIILLRHNLVASCLTVIPIAMEVILMIMYLNL